MAFSGALRMTGRTSCSQLLITTFESCTVQSVVKELEMAQEKYKSPSDGKHRFGSTPRSWGRFQNRFVILITLNPYIITS